MAAVIRLHPDVGPDEDDNFMSRELGCKWFTPVLVAPEDAGAPYVGGLTLLRMCG